MNEKTSGIKELVAQLGFPIVVAGWLLWERWTMMTDYNATLVQLTDAISKNSDMVRQLMEIVK